MTDTVSACLNLMRRMPPKDIEVNLTGLVTLAPDCMDELLQRIDQPLQEATDPVTGRQYLLCEYNRDADSYRSPWSNAYDPPLEDAYELRDQLRQLEIDANELLDAYRELYYQGGTSSVYLWDLEEGSGKGFAGAFLIKKSTAEGTAWESIHVIQVDPDVGGGKRATYKLNSTIMLSVQQQQQSSSSAAADGGGGSGGTSLSGNMTSAAEQTLAFASQDDHLSNIGKMIEKMENDVRMSIDGVYVQKTRQILCSVRRSNASAPAQGAAFTSQLNQAIGAHGAKRDGGLAAQIAALNFKKTAAAAQEG
ncbi:F-actin-capping protein subunit beta [Tribonema minus]|uniref:F-actin-capping protein subunit beta n=1 Tax=Tribonema minus TaxID=303371 RepID=A0A835YY13_9STRA|nr:F-actin-capping protein subunit beta [Tribonema minus]